MREGQLKGLLLMSIQPYVGPIGSNNGAVVALNTAQEITPEEYERRQKEVRSSSAACLPCKSPQCQMARSSFLGRIDFLTSLQWLAKPWQLTWLYCSDCPFPHSISAWRRQKSLKRSSNSSQRRFPTESVKSWAPMLEQAVASSTCTEW